MVIPLFQIIIRIVVIADTSGNSTSLSQLKQKLWAPAEPGTEKSVAPPKDNPTAMENTQWLYILISPVNSAFCMFPRGSDDVILILGPYFVSLLLSLLLPNSLLLFPEMFSQKNYLYPTLVLGSASKEKEHNNNWGLFLITRGLSLWLRW